MKKYLIETNQLNGGIQKKYRFPNDFGASVVKHRCSYGYEKDLWEIAILKFIGDESNLCYNTPITDDVLGHQSDKNVKEVLKKIKDFAKGINNKIK